MRRFDATAGRLLCMVLTFARRLGMGGTDPGGRPSRILLVKLAEQGATVAARPAIEDAIDLVGSRDHVYVCVFAQNRPILDQLGVIDRDHVLAIRTDSTGRLLLDVARTVLRCRRLGLDAGADFEFFSRSSAALLFLSGARRRAGLHSFAGEGPQRGDLMTHRISANPLQHASHTFRSLVAALAGPPGRLPAIEAGPWALEAPALLPPSGSARRRARALLHGDGSDQRRSTVLLNPNAGDLVPLRRWPADRYVALARGLLDDDPTLQVVLTGSHAEREACASIVEQVGSPRCTSVAGATTMEELLALYWEADVLVTNDSGPAHYASTSPIDTIALFGPETPAVFGPTSARSHNVWAALPCSPCVNAFNNRLSPCRDNICMQRITVEQVRTQVDLALASRR